MIGPYHKNDNGEKFIKVFGVANGRKETNFIVDCRIILVWILQIHNGKCGNKSSGSTRGPVMKACEHGDVV